MKYENSSLDFISLIEIIEHLYPDVLEKFAHSIFGLLKPKFVLITTPNREFNVVFEDIESQYGIRNGERGDDENKNNFRHWDHKFEWTRAEFQTWCQTQVLDKYTNYCLYEDYSGLGKPPVGYEHVGDCTQMALFVRTDIDKQPNALSKFQTYIKVDIFYDHFVYH